MVLLSELEHGVWVEHEEHGQGQIREGMTSKDLVIYYDKFPEATRPLPPLKELRLLLPGERKPPSGQSSE